MSSIQNSKLKIQNSGRLKVAHIITRLELGGAQQNTLYCCSHHDPKRFDVILLTGPGGLLDAEAKSRSDRYRTYFLPSLRHPVHPWWDLVAFFRIVLILRKEKVQVVHTHSSKAGILGRWAAWFARVPRILHTVHGWGFHSGQPFLLRWFYQWLERRAAKITDVLITVSRDNRREGLAHGIGREDRYRVIHSGIEPREFVLGAEEAARARRKFGSEKRPCVLVLSNFKPQKSPLDVVRVAGILSVRIPNVLVLWAGDGELRPQVEEDLKGRGLSGNFELLGWRDDVPQLLAASGALLLTSLYEGLPRVVLQAMAAGKPVVATDVSGTPEAVAPGQTGFLHPPHDWEGMADSLYKILTDPKLASELAKNGKEALQGTFLIREMLREIEALYAP